MKSTRITKILSDPTSYPFDVSPASFIVISGRSLRCNTATLALDKSLEISRIRRFVGSASSPRIDNPIGFLTCGSNASPVRLSEKLSHLARPDAYALRIQVNGWTPVYSATVSYYGSIPATFEFTRGQIAEPFLIVMDRLNLPSIIESEQRTQNYDTYSVPPLELGITTDFPIYAFIARHGAIKLNKQVIPLNEFQVPGGHLTFSQAELISLIYSEVYGAAIRKDEYNQKARDANFVAEFRGLVNARFSSPPNVPGWKRLKFGFEHA